jgi:hypothetical protein
MSSEDSHPNDDLEGLAIALNGMPHRGMLSVAESDFVLAALSKGAVVPLSSWGHSVSHPPVLDITRIDEHRYEISSQDRKFCFNAELSSEWYVMHPDFIGADVAGYTLETDDKQMPAVPVDACLQARLYSKS